MMPVDQFGHRLRGLAVEAARTPLPSHFCAAPALRVARRLLGQLLVHRPLSPKDAPERIGRIVEVEAYLGPHDLAAHSSKGLTPRTEVMFRGPGLAYVYFVYGMHHCMNVTAQKGSAVLIRGIEPVSGIEKRTDGPARLTVAMGIDLRHNGHPLQSPPLWLAPGEPVPSRLVARGPRIGVDYAQEWAAKPYRLWVKNNPHVSR